MKTEVLSKQTFMKDSLHNLCNKKLPNKVTHSFLPKNSAPGSSAHHFLFFVLFKEHSTRNDWHTRHLYNWTTCHQRLHLILKQHFFSRNSQICEQPTKIPPSDERPPFTGACTFMCVYVLKTSAKHTKDRRKITTPNNAILYWKIKGELCYSNSFVQPILPSPSIPSKHLH